MPELSLIIIGRVLCIIPHLGVLVHPETLHCNPDGWEGDEEGQVEDVGSRCKSQEEEPEPQDNKDDLVVHIDGEDADGVDELNAGAGPTHADIAIDKAGRRREIYVRRNELLMIDMHTSYRGKRRIMVSSR